MCVDIACEYLNNFVCGEYVPLKIYLNMFGVVRYKNVSQGES